MVAKASGRSVRAVEPLLTQRNSILTAGAGSKSEKHVYSRRMTVGEANSRDEIDRVVPQTAGFGRIITVGVIEPKST